MSVILHVGAHKTGTSMIQKYFRDRRVHPADPRVAAVPRSDTNQLIGWGRPVLETPELLRDRLSAELATSPAAVLVSHENSIGRPFDESRSGLYPQARQLADGLAKICAGMDARVVLYVRPIPDFVESYYLQTIHQGAWHDFAEWFDAIDAAALLWQPVIDALEASFEERVVVGDFTEISAGQDEFLRRFMVRSGLPVPAVVHYPPVRNASISDRGLAIAKGINRHLVSIDEKKATRKFLQDHFSNRTDDRARPMPDTVRADLDARTTGEYAALAQRSRDHLHRSSPGPLPDGLARRSAQSLKSLTGRR